MIITSIVENASAVGLPVEHGLSLYVRLNNGQNILFDMGQGRLFADNAERLGLSIAEVDTAIVSHGHYDHGGGLGVFFEKNEKAKVYMHNDAFMPHYSLRDNGLNYIGLDKALATHKRIVFCENELNLGKGVRLFAGVSGTNLLPKANCLLFGPLQTANDNFTHEQHLVVEEDGNVVLFAGCAHSGIVNIMQKAVEVCGKQPTHVVAGMHLVKSGLSQVDEQLFLNQLAQKLMMYKECKYYTMHCTGLEQYQKLKALMGNQIAYLSCGESVVLGVKV